MVRAKMYVASATSSTLSVKKKIEGGEDNEGVSAILVTLEGVNACSGPNTDDEDEDSIYGSYTPHANVSMTITSEPAGRWFAERVGKKVYVDFSDAEA
ncbi:hypothetical protein LCGC14_1254260 [marine sediment metagenome]|uniref:Uncharacterized protein n=1 Tax=marine sediment metagenome TaxID=412755 RepID=A0A0F9L5J5_9ZZZZ